MRLDTSQQMRTEMRLRMAPRMIQSMEILQLPLMALQERIEQELSENPVLVDLRESASPAEAEGEEAGTTAVAEPEPESRAERIRQPDRARRELERALRRGAAAEPGLAQRGSRPQARRHAEHGLAAPLVPRRPDRPARLLRLRPDRPGAGRVHHLQPRRQRLSQARACTTWSATSAATATLEQAEEALRLVQKLDPPGVGARDLRECLLLQLTPERPAATSCRP